MIKQIVTILLICCGAPISGMDIPDELSLQGRTPQERPCCYGCSICSTEEGHEPNRCQQCCSRICCQPAECIPRSTRNLLRDIPRTLGNICCCCCLFPNTIPGERKSYGHLRRKLYGSVCALAWITAIALFLWWAQASQPNPPTPTPLNLPTYFLPDSSRHNKWT